MVVEVRLHHLRADGFASLLGKLVGVLRRSRIIGHTLKDTHEVANGNALRKKILQYALHLTHAEKSRHQLIHEGRIVFLEIVQ